MDEKIKQALIDIVGEKNYIDRLVDIVPYSYDASEHFHRPSCAVCVEATKQVSEILKLANQECVPVTPRGAGTSLSGMAVPIRGGIILDLNHMNKILRISIEDRMAVVEPGVVCADFEKAIEPTGFFYPPAPASGKVATLGGNVATSAGGMRGSKYGTTRDYVLGLEVVLADGSILRTGSSCMKSVSGYDLTRLFVGSEGTLGVVTEISLKINPKPLATVTCSATFDDIVQAGKAVSEIMRSGIVPAVLEFLDDQAIQALNRATSLNLPEAAAILLVETDGYTEAEIDYQMAKVIEALRRNDAKGISRATSAEEVEELWTARKSIFGVLSRLNKNLLVEDVTVPISKVVEMLLGIHDISQRYNILMPTLGHFGDGNFHPNITYNGTNPGETARAEQAVADLFKLAIDLGGTLTGEHGIGLSKAKFMPLEHNTVAMRVMNNVKKMLDPKNILNPGKMGLEV